MGDYCFRTAVTGIEVYELQAAALDEMIAEWRRGCQLAMDAGWQRKLISRSELQPVVYESILEETQLSSQHTLLAIRQPSDALVGVAERRERGRTVTKPEFTSPTVTYDARTMTLFDDESVSLTTTGDRVRCQILPPDDEDGYQWQFIQSADWRLSESNLTRRDGTFRLHLRFRTHTSDVDRSEPAIHLIEVVVGMGTVIARVRLGLTQNRLLGRTLGPCLTDLHFDYDDIPVLITRDQVGTP